MLLFSVCSEIFAMSVPISLSTMASSKKAENWINAFLLGLLCRGQGFRPAQVWIRAFRYVSNSALLSCDTDTERLPNSLREGNVSD